jgi:hypothetical protein
MVWHLPCVVQGSSRLLALILAVGRIFTLSRMSDRLERQFAGHEVVAASLTSDGIARINGQVPDIVIFPQSLFPSEKAALVSRLRAWGGSETAGETAVAMRAPSLRGADGEWFYWFKSPEAKKLVVGRLDVRTTPPPPREPARPPRVAAAPAAEEPAAIAVDTAAAQEPAIAAEVAAVVDNGPSSLQRLTASAGDVVRRGGTLTRLGAGALARVAVAGAAGAARGASRGFKASASLASAMWTTTGRLGARAASQAARIRMPEASTRKTILKVGAATAAAAVTIVLGGGVVRQVGAMASAAALKRSPPVPAPVATVHASTATTGGLNVVSEPPGATVAIDGRERGVTPLVLNDLSPGQHVVTLSHEAGSVRQSVRVKPNETGNIDVPLFTGWVAVFAPFELRISDGGKPVALDEQSHAMLSPGTHELQLTNRTLNYRSTQTVVVRPGQVTPISIVPPNTPVTLTSNPPADVWIDGTRIGQTPLHGVGVAIGTREFIFRSAEAGERRFMKTVTTLPLQIDVDLTRSDQ